MGDNNNKLTQDKLKKSIDNGVEEFMGNLMGRLLPSKATKTIDSIWDIVGDAVETQAIDAQQELQIEKEQKELERKVKNNTMLIENFCQFTGITHKEYLSKQKQYKNEFETYKKALFED